MPNSRRYGVAPARTSAGVGCGEKVLGRLAQSIECGFERWAQRVIEVGSLIAHLLDEPANHGAACHGQLAQDQIHRLDSVGSFVDGSDPCVAPMLGAAGLLHKSHPAVDLNTQRSELDPEVRAPALGDRCQQRSQTYRILAVVFGFCGDAAIDGCRVVVHQRSHCIDCWPSWSAACGERPGAR